MRKTLTTVAVLAAVLVGAACTAPPPVEAPPALTPAEKARTEVQTGMEYVSTACTAQGHRLFKYQDAGRKGGLAVVENDPTCGAAKG